MHGQKGDDIQTLYEKEVEDREGERRRDGTRRMMVLNKVGNIFLILKPNK